MRLRWYILLFFIEILILGGLSRIQQVPGYMDAEYYFTTGGQLADGKGFFEPFLWNYLDHPIGLPHPSHTYWMPLASLAAALGGLVCGPYSFTCARIPFILLAGFVPCITAYLAYRMTGKTSSAILAGCFSIFSGMYLVYLPTTDTFPLYMLLGSGFVLLMPAAVKGSKQARRIAFVSAGALAGLLHLTRNDGLIWLAAGIAWIWVEGGSSRLGRPLTTDSRTLDVPELRASWQDRAWSSTVFICGYLVLMGPWMARNMSLFGTLLAPGGSSTLWMVEYDELYSLTSQNIDFSRWVASGISPILSTRWNAFIWNIQTAWVVQGGIILAPLMAYGAICLVKKRAISWLPLEVLAVLLVVMTVIFPFAGPRGGYLHAGAAVQPFLWALIPSGLEGLVEWGARKRGWHKGQAFNVFAAGLVVLMMLVTAVLYVRKVIGTAPNQIAWNQGWKAYTAWETVLAEKGVPDSAVVLVNNPPGFFAATGRPAVVIPSGDEGQTLEAAGRYGAGYLLLDENNARWLPDLYENPAGHAGFSLITTMDGMHLFEIEP